MSRSKDHDDHRPCDYQIHEECHKVLKPHEGTPHYGFVDMDYFRETGKTRTSDEVKWACIECEMYFDED